MRYSFIPLVPYLVFSLLAGCAFGKNKKLLETEFQPSGLPLSSSPSPDDGDKNPIVSPSPSVSPVPVSSKSQESDSFVHRGGLHGSSVSFTSEAFATEAYVPERVNQPLATITYDAMADDICWTIISIHTSGITGWNRVGDSAYYYKCQGSRYPSQPPLPSHSTWLLGPVTISASAITSVADHRTPSSYAKSRVFDVTDPLYGAVGDGVIDDSIAIQAALDAAGAFGGGRVTFPPSGLNAAYLLGTRGLRVKHHGIQLIGPRANLNYRGRGSAIDAEVINNTVYPQEVRIEGITIGLGSNDDGAQGAFGINWRFTHSTCREVSIFLSATNQRGFNVPGDDNGTGPYYNIFEQCNVQGNSGLGQKGVWLTSGAAGLTPNSNTWIGGRVGQVATGYQITGFGNRFFSPTAEGMTSKSFRFAYESSATVGCADNTVFGPYIEGANTAIGIEFATLSIRSTVLYPTITGVALGLSDLTPKSAGNRVILDEVWSSPPFNALDFSATGAMTWTVDAADLQTYAYSLQGRTLTVSFAFQGTSVGGSPDTALTIKIPDRYVAKKTMFDTFTYGDNSNSNLAIGTTRVSAGGTVIELYKTPLANTIWSTSTDLTFVFGTVSFEVQ